MSLYLSVTVLLHKVSFALDPSFRCSSWFEISGVATWSILQCLFMPFFFLVLILVCFLLVPYFSHPSQHTLSLLIDSHTGVLFGNSCYSSSFGIASCLVGLSRLSFSFSQISWHGRLAFSLAFIGSVSILFAHHLNALPVYSFLASDHPTSMFITSILVYSLFLGRCSRLTSASSTDSLSHYVLTSLAS